MQNYKLIGKKGEGAFSEVLKAQSNKTGNVVAIKCMKTHFSSREQVNQLREIQALKKLSPHPHIITLHEVLFDEPTGRLALVFELMDMNMYELIKDRKTHLPHAKVKLYMYQLFKAINHMHKKGIFHRDIKPENVLLIGDTIKLADFGSCRGTYSSHPYTEYISTRWYRPPECLMTDGYYDHKMDIWGAGCIMYEILTLHPLFPGSNELDMIHRIHNVLGTPPLNIIERFKRHATHMDFNFPERPGIGFEKSLNHVSRDCIDLLKLLLAYDSEERITADQALKHEYFKDLWEAERQKDVQNSLTLIKLTPYSSQASQIVGSDYEKHSPNIFKEHERTNYHQDAQKVKAKKKNHSFERYTKPPYITLTLKVEGLFKQSPHPKDMLISDENRKKEFTLPPLQQHSNMHSDTKIQFFGQTGTHASFLKIKEEDRKFDSTILKPCLSNQNLFKKAKKPSMAFRTPDYDLAISKIF